MATRLNVLLAVVLVAQVLLIAALRLPAPGRSGDEPRPLFPELAEATIERIEVIDRDGETLVLGRDGDSWGLPEADGYPVDSNKVDELIGQLADLEVRAPIVTSADYHEALGVSEAEMERRVQLFAADDELLADLVVGSSPQYRIHHVRRGGEDAVYEVRGLAPYEMRAEATAWADRRFFDVALDDVRRVLLDNEKGRIELVRDGEGWRLGPSHGERTGEAIGSDQGDELVRALASLWVAEPVGRLDESAQGLDAPVARWEIEYAQGAGGVPSSDAKEAASEAAEDEAETDAKPVEETTKRIVVRIGARHEEDGSPERRLVAKSDFAWVVAVEESALDAALTRDLSELEADE